MRYHEKKKNRSKEDKWALIISNQFIKNSQIIYIYIYIYYDGEDNNLESLGKGHLSLTHKIHKQDRHKEMRVSKSSHTNSYKQLTKKMALNG